MGWEKGGGWTREEGRKRGLGAAGALVAEYVDARSGVVGAGDALGEEEQPVFSPLSTRLTEKQPPSAQGGLLRLPPRSWYAAIDTCTRVDGEDVTKCSVQR